MDGTHGWTKDGEPINVCHMPKEMDPRLAAVMQRVHGMNCAHKDDPAHKVCVGKMTVDHHGMTLSCPLCGDNRQTFPKERAS